MARIVYVERGRPGVWPDGEAPDVREAYDEWLREHGTSAPRVIPATKRSSR